MTETDERKFLENSISRIVANVKTELILDTKGVSEETINKLCIFCKTNNYEYQINIRKGRIHVFNR